MMNALLKGRIGKKKYQEFWKRLYLMSLKGMNYGNSTFESNGEKNTIENVKRFLEGKHKIVLFDVGANVGEYTRILLDQFKDKDYLIHAFEPSKVTYITLTKNIQSEKVVLNNCGLSDVCENATLWSDKDNSTLASIYHRQLDEFGIDNSKTEDIELITLDSYCEKNSIHRIDFLKIDVEGNDYNVLKGAQEMIRNKQISYIQFEFGGADIDSRVFFRDFWNLLHENYHICRIVKDGFYEIEKYSEKDEIFTYVNFFCYCK